MSKRFWVLVTIACLVLPCATAFGQQTTATIRGRVADPQDAVVVGATVVARNVDTGIERKTTTTSDGLFSITFLPSGIYDLRVEATNFAKGETKGVKLAVGDIRDVNFQLQVGGGTQTVEVSGQAPLVETTNTQGSTVVNDADLARLPTQAGTAPGSIGNMNDYATLAVGTTGVHVDLTGDSADLVGPGQYNNRSNQYNVDGGTMNDVTTVGRTALGASVDEVKEFQVLTNNYNAEYGQAGGLILNVITKSGTNQIHGDFHFYARGTNMEGVPYFTKLGFDSTDPSTAGALSPPPFYKHETGFTLGGPLIKDKTFWFASLEKVQAGIPLALPPPVNQTVSQGDDELLWSFKLDHQINANNHFTGRFNVQRSRLSNLLVQTPAATFPNGLTGDVGHDLTMNVAVTSTLTPHTVNEARVVWHRFLGPETPTNTDAPGIRTQNTYEGADFCCPQGGLQNRYTGSDNFTWVHGAHTFKTGVKMDYEPWSALFPQFHFGEWDSLQCNYPQTAPGTGCGPAVFTIGIGPAETRSKDNVYAWFVQDSWKIRPNLTMNYGVRWDYEAGAFKGGKIPFSGNDFGSGCFEGNGLISACSSDKNNFQPRLGLAWSPRFDSGLMHKIFGDSDRSLISAAFSEVTQLAYGNIALDSLNFDGTAGSLQTIVINAGDPNSGPIFAAWPNRPPDSALAPFLTPPGPPSPPFGRIRPISPNIRNPETRNVQMTFQRELSNTMVMSIGYLGSFGFGQFGEFDQNYPTILPDPAHPGYFYTTGRPDPDFGAIRENFSGRTSAYNGLTVSIEKRYSHHLQINGNYTWSHLIASTEGFYGVSEPSNPFDVRGSTRGPASQDVRHLANVTFTVDSDNRFHSMGFLDHVFNNWAFSMIGTAQSGRPYMFSTGDSVLQSEYFASFGAESMQTPIILPDGSITTSGLAGSNGANFLVSGSGPAPGGGAYPCPTCPTNTFAAPAGASSSGPIDMFSGIPVDFQVINGNVGRNQGRGDPFVRGDISLRRAFKLPFREGMSVQLRADLFNFANHTNFWLFNGNDVLSLLGGAGGACGASTFTNNGLLLTFTPNPGCSGGAAGLDVVSGKYFGSNGKILTLSDVQHGRVSNNLNSPIFNGLGDPGGADIPRQAQFSIKVTF